MTYIETPTRLGAADKAAVTDEGAGVLAFMTSGSASTEIDFAVAT